MRFEDSKVIVANEDVMPIDEQYRHLNYERLRFLKLTGNLRHYCPDWDFMAIDENCPEMQCCTCAFQTDPWSISKMPH